MRNLTFSLLAVAATAIAFFAGRATAPGLDPTLAAPAVPTGPGMSMPEPGVEDHHAELLRALELPIGERERFMRLAMNAWLAQDGADALRTARDDPRLSEVNDLMAQIAMAVHPEVFTEDPSLFDGAAEAGGPIVLPREAIAALGQEVARQAGLEIGLNAALGSATAPVAEYGHPLSVDDAYAEVESILAERSPMKRLPRLLMLVSQMAQSDPAAAAALVDSLPASDRRHAIDALTSHWVQSDPQAAAHWLGNQGGRDTAHRFTQLAQHWGMRDFESASGFAATLSGSRRHGFLIGLASAVHQLPNSEKLAWIAGLEGDPNYANLAPIVAQGIAQEDLDAALTLIESLPSEERLNAYSHVLPMMAMQDPEAAMAAIEVIGDPSQREQLIAMVTPMWAQVDPDRAMNRALDLTPGPTRDQALASIAFELAYSDSQRAIEAIGHIDNPTLSRGPVLMVLKHLEDDSEAIRLGRNHGLDREAVLAARADSLGRLSGRILPMPWVTAPGNAVIGFGPSTFTAPIGGPPIVVPDDGRGASRAADAPSDGDG